MFKRPVEVEKGCIKHTDYLSDDIARLYAFARFVVRKSLEKEFGIMYLDIKRCIEGKRPCDDVLSVLAQLEQNKDLKKEFEQFASKIRENKVTVIICKEDNKLKYTILDH
ncbi:MAG: hypothetical protein JZD41_03610 [Thermoproteus sp.]|nr:hypothetical protein [Thermoproteus sp.]